jgi:hypothetical protein
MTIELEGNIISGPIDTQHFNAHQSMELFWDQFRPATKSFPAGSRYGEIPTNLEYTRALKSSLQNASLSEAQINQSLREAIRQRLQYGLLGGMEVPLKFDRYGNFKIPNRINSVYRGLQ